jgi:phosphoglycolate phosphatase-like HAD superfamily hydrolase
MLGPAPVVDFDGTLAVLPVAWDELRRRLGVRRIDDLWSGGGGEKGWRWVTQAEVEGAATAQPVAPVISALAEAHAVAVLSSNSERSIWRFLQRFEALRAVVAAVVGRETLAGPKREPDVFIRGFHRCVEATMAARPTSEPVVFVGDEHYELQLARRLGARALHVDEVRSS